MIDDQLVAETLYAIQKECRRMMLSKPEREHAVVLTSLKFHEQAMKVLQERNMQITDHKGLPTGHLFVYGMRVVEVPYYHHSTFEIRFQIDNNIRL